MDDKDEKQDEKQDDKNERHGRYHIIRAVRDEDGNRVRYEEVDAWEEAYARD